MPIYLDFRSLGDSTITSFVGRTEGTKVSITIDDSSTNTYTTENRDILCFQNTFAAVPGHPGAVEVEAATSWTNELRSGIFG